MSKTNKKDYKEHSVFSYSKIWVDVSWSISPDIKYRKKKIKEESQGLNYAISRIKKKKKDSTQ